MSDPLDPQSSADSPSTPDNEAMQPDVTECNQSHPHPSIPDPLQITRKPILTYPHPTHLDPLSVSSLQLRAITLILQGHSTGHIAKSLSISRVTLYRWNNFHAGFIAELGRRRKELHATARQRLGQLLTRSLKVVSKDLSSDNHAHRLAAARTIIAHCAPRTTAPDPSEPTTPDDIINPLAEHFRKQICGNACDGLPLNSENRKEALRYLSQSLAAPHLEDDPA